MSEANHRGDPQPPLWRSLEHRWSGEIEDEFPAGAETWDETL
jgi:hypothetical protein